MVNESLNNNDSHSLSVAFLVIRQVSLQGGHVFQPYVTWFQVSVYVVVVFQGLFLVCTFSGILAAHEFSRHLHKRARAQRYGFSFRLSSEEI